jgi:hypothetical protein
MKKSLLIAVLGMAAVAAYGQGRINFGNYYSSTQTTGITYGYGPYAGLGVGPEITVTLLWGASTITDFHLLSPVAGSATVVGLGVAPGPAPIGGGTGAGWFAGPILSINGGTAGNYAFCVEALQGQIVSGLSPVVVGATSATSSSPTPDLPLALGNFVIFLMPEPSVLSLSGMGAAVLMLVRRRFASNPAVARDDRKK